MELCGHIVLFRILLVTLLCKITCYVLIYLWAYGVVDSMFDFHRSDRGSNPGRGGERFHNVYDYTIERHPWQVSESHKLRVHPSHVREIG